MEVVLRRDSLLLVFAQLVPLEPPRRLARLARVCKCWRRTLYDGQSLSLWAHVLKHYFGRRWYGASVALLDASFQGRWASLRTVRLYELVTTLHPALLPSITATFEWRYHANPSKVAWPLEGTVTCLLQGVLFRLRFQQGSRQSSNGPPGAEAAPFRLTFVDSTQLPIRSTNDELIVVSGTPTTTGITYARNTWDLEQGPDLPVVVLQYCNSDPLTLLEDLILALPQLRRHRQARRPISRYPFPPWLLLSCW